MRSHLWESEDAGVAAGSIVWAAVRGAVDDVTWTVARGVVGFARLLRTPTPYVVLAGAATLQAAVLSMTVMKDGRSYVHVSSLIGVGALALAGVVWCVRKLR
jgi:hypothetical protein